MKIIKDKRQASELAIALNTHFLHLGKSNRQAKAFRKQHVSPQRRKGGAK